MSLKLTNHNYRIVAGDVDLMRHRARTDLYYLSKMILGYKDLAPMHRELCKHADSTRQDARRVFLLPRGHLKSTILTVAATIQQIVRSHGEGSDGRECSIGIGSWDQRTARALLQEIKRHLEHNEMLRHVFPDVFYDEPRTEASLWKVDAISVRQQRNQARPTVLAFSCESPPTGFHFDRLIIDDMVTHENSRTATLVSKTHDRASDLTNLLVRPSDPIDYIGTRHHWADLYGTLCQRRNVVSYVRSALNAHNRPIFPQRFSLQSLMQMRADDPVAFAAQQMMAPLMDQRFEIDAQDLPRYTTSPPRHAMHVVTMLDPAVSRKANADYSAAIVLGIDSRDNVYLLDGFRERLGPAQLGRAYAKLIARWQPDRALCESIGFQAYVLEAVRAAGAESVEGIVAKGAKEDRIRAVYPVVAGRHLHLPANGLVKTSRSGYRYDLCRIWLDEFSRFPHGDHDDLLDATATALSVRPRYIADVTAPAYDPRTLRHDALQEADHHFHYGDTDDFVDDELYDPQPSDGLLGDYY